MSPLITEKCCILFGIIMVLHVNGCQFTQIQTYKDPCNETIILSDIGGAGQLVYHHNKHMNKQYCKIVIKAEQGHRIGYVLRKRSAYRAIYSRNDHLYFICTSLAFYEGDVQTRYNCLNASSNTTQQVETTQENTLTVETFGDDYKSFNFELVFFSFHYDTCRSNETQCRLRKHEYVYACVGQNSILDNISIFCDSDYGDYDSTYKNNNNDMIAGVVLTCIIFIPMLLLGTCVVYRRYCKQPEEDVEDIPTRARRLFAAIVENAHDNDGFDTGDIDPRKFDPPPEYDTLDQLDESSVDRSCSNSDKHLSPISNDRPPNYLDVMNNSNEYLVSCHI